MGLSMRVDEKAVADCAPGPVRQKTPALRPNGSAGSGAGGRAAAVARCGALNPESGILTDPTGLLTRGGANPPYLSPRLARVLPRRGDPRRDRHMTRRSTVKTSIPVTIVLSIVRRH